MAQAVAVAFLCFVFPLLVLLAVLRSARARRSRRSGKDDLQYVDDGRLPPSPPGQLPIIGHLHLVGSHPHVSLRDIADTHGADGLVLLRLGQVPNLVVSSPTAAEAVLRTHDHAFASRPRSEVTHILFGGSSDVALAPYGGYWRQARKLITTHLLSAAKVRSLRGAREAEVRRALAVVGEAAAARAAVDVGEVVGSFVNDLVCRAVLGQRHGRNNRMLLRELIEGNTRILGGFTLYDHFPSLAKVPLLTRMLCAGITRHKRRWDVLLHEIIDQHHLHAKENDDDQLQRHEEEEEDDDDSRDFMGVLLSLQQEYGLTREHVKAILMDMFAAGIDTSSIVLEYAMVHLVKNPHLMAKLQAEISSNTPRGQEMVKEENLDSMTYLKAVVKETLRLHPPAPLLLPHLSMETCDVNGYTIPAGTRVIVNAWALGRDPRSWEKADEFIPERFVPCCGKDTPSVDDFKGRDFRFLPFGAGRRICAGANFGVATVEIMLANLVYGFDWELPAGISREDIDMTEVFGITVHRKEKLLLLPTSLRNVNHI
jgi:cytochrome P450